MARPKKPGGKRERLVEAAARLAQRQGYRRTTLADIATESGVQLGNVYYYFRTKDDIGEAVLQHREGEFAFVRQHMDALPTPLERLLAFVDRTIASAPVVAESGCPMGSLSAEFAKDGGGLAERAKSLLGEPMAWMAEQFGAMGAADPEGLALQLQSSLQGASLLTQTSRNPALLEREGCRLRKWLEGLAA